MGIPGGGPPEPGAGLGNGIPVGGGNGKGIPAGGDPAAPGVGGGKGIPLGGKGGIPLGGKGNGGIPRPAPCGGNGILPGGGGIKPNGGAARPAWVPPGSMGFALACPSAAYDEVMLSMTD